MKKFLILLLPSILFFSAAFAGEGMWLPILLKQYNEKDMQAQGLKLSADDIYNINKSSLKDAIVSLGGFCTAEIVSEEGLLFTNHHCGYSAIADHSTKEHDYLKNGFWYKSKEEELPNEGLTASILVYMKDVTHLIIDSANKIKDESRRMLVIQKLRDSIEKAEPNPDHYKIQVRSFFKGNEFYLLAYEVFKDVRLVAAPPASIGKYGGDQDNWMWPRHTGDFSILRIYMGKDGKPAKYSKDNIPYKPKHFLPISLQGVKKDDFTMIMGYPGSTDRYLTSAEFEYASNIENPASIDAMGTVINVMKQDMDADRGVALALASEFASTSNTYKYFQGQERQLKQMTYISAQKEKEANFTKWVNADDARKEKYGKIFEKIQEAEEKQKSIEPAYSFVVSGLFGAPCVRYGFSFYSLYKEIDAKGIKRAMIDSLTIGYSDKIKEYFEKGILPTDRKILTAELQLMYKNMPGEKRPDFISKIIAKNKKIDASMAIQNYVNDIFKNSDILASQERADKFIKKVTAKKLEKDPFFDLLAGIINFYYADLAATKTSVNNTLSQYHRLYIQGLREWQSDKKFYPDANSTLRVTYGKVEPYLPKDAVSYKYYTTYTGILEKYNPDDPEFNAPARQIELLKNKQFGRYAENDTLRINFITTTDITGGNSGSPVMDAKGRLVGLAFDGDWESMIGDLVVDPKLNRTIAVDIRYVLWVIDVFAGADNIMKELKIE